MLRMHKSAYQQFDTKIPLLSNNIPNDQEDKIFKKSQLDRHCHNVI